MTDQKLSALRARYLFPVAGPPLRDAAITIVGERIVAVGGGAPVVGTRDLGNVAILPGLVNAHTHLEFSDLAEPLGTPGESLPSWIRRVIAERRARPPGAASGIAQGLAESIRAGTTMLGEIGTAAWPDTARPAADIVVLRETIGLAPETCDARLAAARVHLAEPWAERGPLRAGLSPHAPYSVHPELLMRLAELARERRAPLAMHLAESPEELEILATGGGPFRQLLEDLQAWSPGAIRPGSRVLDYLRLLAIAPGCSSSTATIWRAMKSSSSPITPTA